MDRKRDFDTWKLFARTVRLGSISRAAIELGIDASAASRRLFELEHSVGEALLNRKRRPITTTAKGEELFEVVIPIVDAYENFLSSQFSIPVASQSGSNELPQRVISISVYQGYGHECLPPLLQEYMKVHPHISFKLFQEKNIADLESGEVDIFVSASSVYRPLLKRQETRLLPCILACSPLYLERNGTPQTPEDLVKHIALERIGENFPVSKGLIFKANTAFQANFGQKIFSESSIALRDSAVAGLGIVFDLPAEFMLSELRQGKLVQVLRGWHRKPFPRSVIVSKTNVVARPEVKEFADWLTIREREESFKREMQVFSVLKENASDYR